MRKHRQPPLSQVDAKRIALIKPSALGDVVHALPILNALRQRFPVAKITWVVNRAYESLLAGHAAVDETLPFDRQGLKNGLRSSITGISQFASQLRRRRFDLVIDLQGLLRSGLMTAATGASRRVGLGTAREGAHWFYTDVIPTPLAKEQHAIDRYWLVAEALGVGDLCKRFDVPVSNEARNWAERELLILPRPLLAFGVGARWITKRWPPESFTVLAQRSQKHFGGTILFIGTADETPLARQVATTLVGSWRDYSGKTTLPQLAALLERVDVMVANDTGPLHLAAALGRPCVAPYTCTQTRRHGPYGSMRGAVESAVWCQGSYVKKCDRLECMSELHPDRLWIFLHEILATWARNSRSA
jgi:lipopolysaccharide heptosyltransferase I